MSTMRVGVGAFSPVVGVDVVPSFGSVFAENVKVSKERGKQKMKRIILFSNVWQAK